MASAKERRRRPTHRTSRGSVFFLLSASLARVAARHKNKHLPVCAPSMASRLRVTAGKSQIFLAARDGNHVEGQFGPVFWEKIGFGNSETQPEFDIPDAFFRN